MKNIHIIKTDKPSRLHLIEDVLTFTNEYKNSVCDSEVNIYITNSEEIKEGDWCISLCDDESYEEIYQCKDVSLVDEEDKKIILTTDQDLIKDGVQAIDDDFLEWFVKNPSCEEVEVKSFKSYSKDNYIMFIPKEEPKQETLEEAAEKYARKQCDDMYDDIAPSGGSWGWETSTDFIAGAKWMQERSYSEEEVYEILAQFVNDAPTITKEWFEQFKKK